MPENAREKKFTFGTCAFDFTNPNQESLSPTTRTLNVIVSFEEALKMNLALDECLRKLNHYKRSTKEGKRAAVNLCLHLLAGRIAINEGKLKK